MSETGNTATEAGSLEGLVGTRTSKSVVVVERGPVSLFADAVLDPNPVYHRPDAAAEAGFPAIPAPPTYPFVMAYWGTFPEAQPADGEAQGAMTDLVAPFLEPGGLILHGEQEFEYHRPVMVGDVLEGEGKVVDAYRKESKGHTMTFVVVETSWTERQTGAPVVTSRFNLIYRV